MKHRPFAVPLLALSSALTLSSCSPYQPNSSSESESFSSSSLDSSSSSSSEEPKKVFSIIDDGFSDYKIVIPAEANANLNLASSELSYFLSQSTGCSLSVVSDEAAPSKYISLGVTKLLQASPSYDKDKEDYGLSGYRIFAEDENVYIYGTSSKSLGTLYGVYDFLGESIGYQAYASDEYYYETKSSVSYCVKDEVTIPSFDTRCIGYKETNTDATLARRLRLENQAGSDDWYGFGHSQINGFYFNVADREEKIASKEWQSDWFANGSAEASNNQLCYTGGEKLVKMVANAMIEKIKAYPDATYFMFGQQDNSSFCTCSRCEKAKKEWGCNTSGLQIAFMNEVIKITDAYLEANEPGRKVRYVVFSYMETVSAPVKKENDEYVPYSEKVIPNENLYFYYAPIGTDFSKGLDEVDNQTYYEAIKGWNAIASGRILCYLYDINFRNYFINFYNVNTVKNMYSLYKKFGVTYMYSQGPLDTAVPCFEEARVYIESRLMWDVSLDYETLLDDFLTHYYGPASSYVKQYWDLTFNACAEFSAAGNPIGGIYSAIGTTDLWDEPLVSAFRSCFDKAYESISGLELEDPTLYSTLFTRLKKIELTVLFLELSNYADYFSSDEQKQKKSDFDKYCAQFGITKTSEGGGIDLPDF